MRGIGAVIHFRPPTDSSMPSPDLSGRWNSIRDWFSLPVQDEAAQCFRVFYQPDEATSPSDRLKNFLKLKALASPGRQDNFATERILGTGETICMIASGKNSDFPPVTLHLSDQEWHMTQSQEETADCTVLPLSAGNPAATTAEESAGASRKGSRITNTQIQAWRDLSPEAKRKAGGWKIWAQPQGISISGAKQYLTNAGLTSRGVERLQPPGEKGSSITNAQIQAWRDLPQDAKLEAGGWIKWVQTQGLSISGAKQYLTNTGLTSRGVERLQPPGEKGSSITNAQIQAWRDLPQEAKLEAGGWMKWVQAQGISIASAGNFLTSTGLTPFGTDRLKQPEERGTSITNMQIRTWRDLPQEAKRKAGGWMTWAQALGIDIGSACSYLTNTGLTPKGVVRLSPAARGIPITETQLLAWFNMSSEQRRASGGWATWAQTQGISYISARKYLAPLDSEIPSSGTSRPQPSATVTSDSPRASTSAATGDEITVSVSTPPASSGEKRSLPSTKEDISAPPAKQMKEEEDDVTWRTHQINNNLPILQHWRDPTISVMAQAEGRIETLQVTRWRPLFNALPRQTKARINQEIRWFLQNEGRHDARMNEMMSVAIPLDDRDGYRGRTVYARTNLAAFTVLGPYSGRLLDSETVRGEYEKEYGREASNYYFATRSQERIVSGFPQGNILSLLNSPVFTQRTAEAEARQNVSAVLVGKNIHFFLTTRDIRAGEELWFDYGPDYQHFEPGEALRSVQVKVEPPSPKSDSI
ncbi:SET domain-containing protein-lysine N-methyltransferase [Salmonella enterica subsp. houtenae serovar 40:z4,z32:-]|nr:SET domain-containing protein-lysine N-methyltransferase [Salmonella enterica]EEN1070391.1 SET domain-containing protein-lysine N-methyltransferase [Salmonella enterica subsp. enterica]OSD46312.1 SET domain-containing protein-lysine N-methyltransferase [Salmonella enterica subsp. houtenae serovar 40:z4,z32:-]EAY0683430.1 SET domain-containing protein-lysine N-methyltransferase [Salmonella enterica]EAY1794959.1 SET domain-containing protein-lysine N-methyltransferase [Salmonella enterica]